MNFNYNHLYHQDPARAWNDIVKIHDLLNKAASQGLKHRDAKLDVIIKQLRKNVFDPSHEAAFVADFFKKEDVWNGVNNKIYSLYSEDANVSKQVRTKKVIKQILKQITKIGLSATNEILAGNDHDYKEKIKREMSDGVNSFVWAAELLKVSHQNGLDHVFHFLLEQIQRPLETNFSIFDSSIKTNRLDIVREFVRFGCRLDQTNSNGETPLTLAIQYASSELIKIIVDAGANLSQRNQKGFTPLTLAISLKKTEAVKFLLTAGADPSEKDGLESTPLNAAFVTYNDDLVKLLIIAKADVNAPLLSGFYPIHEAIFGKDLSLIPLLHQAGADLDRHNHQGHTPLNLALFNNRGERETISALLVEGVDPNKRDKDGDTPLMNALVLKKTELAKQLMEAGADVNYPSAKGDYPIYWAIRLGDPQFMRLLIRRGVNIEVRDDKGRSPLESALFYQNQPIISILKKAGADSLYVDNVKSGRFLTNVWGIDGKAQVTGKNRLRQKTNFEGIWGMKDVVPFFLSYLEKFFAFVGVSEPSLTANVKDWMLRAFSNAYPSKSLEEIIAARQARHPCLILGGCVGHAITMSVTEGRLTVSNRGLGSELQRYATEVFALPQVMETKEFFEKLAKKYDTVVEFYVMLRSLRLKTIGGFYHPDQKTGNCAIASTEPVLFYLFLTANPGNIKEARRLYGKFLCFFREEVLKDYKSKGSQSPILLQRIYEKQALQRSQKAKAIRKKIRVR